MIFPEHSISALEILRPGVKGQTHTNYFETCAILQTLLTLNKKRF